MHSLLLRKWRTAVKFSPLCTCSLFNAHPDAFEQHFKHMAGMSNNLKITGVGRAHTMAVFNGIGAFVDCIDDDECMDGLAKKLARNHFERGVNHVRFGVGAAVLLLLLLLPPPPSSSNNIQDQCLVITDIYGVREKGVWLSNSNNSSSSSSSNNNNNNNNSLLLLNTFSLMFLDRGVNHVHFWGRSCGFLVT